MRFLSVCSGIEAASAAWLPMSWQCVGVSEIESFPCAVLAHHYPDVPNYGDMTRYKEWGIKTGDFDLLVGGTPCQSFSVAGLRKGLDDPRGNLLLVFLSMIDWYKPKYVVWENVPGVLSDKTRAFEQFLNGLMELGYVFDADILDARYFGVPQRRRRVFVVAVRTDWVNAFDMEGADERPTDDELFSDYEIRSANGGDNKLWQAARKIKFALGVAKARGSGVGQVQAIKSGLCGDIEESEKERQGIASGVRKGIDCGLPVMYGFHPQDVRYECCTENAGTVVSQYGTGGGNTPLITQSICIPFDTMSLDKRRDKSNACSIGNDGDPSPTIGVAHHHAIGAVQGNTAVVRQLTPVECERLQGFPDNYTRIAWRGRSETECPNSLRYKALGNSMAVPCMRFIGESVQKLDEALRGWAGNLLD